MGKRVYLNNEWYFQKNWEEALCLEVCPEEEMEKVRIPHTCEELPFHYFEESRYEMLCGYRRHLFAPESWSGKTILLTFEGMAHDAEVFLNGKRIGSHHCGYTAFSVDITGELIYGRDNILAVRLDSRESLNIPPFGYVIDYMTYGGIYREVYVDVYENSYLADVFLMPGVDGQRKGKLASVIQIKGKKEKLSLKQFLKRKGEKQDHLLGSSIVPYTEQESGLVEMDFPVEDVALWDVGQPELYEVKTQLLRGDVVLDEKIIVTGFCTREFRKDGFYLNGEKVRICGLNRHQSYPYVGYAMPASMQRMDADILKKELGLNAVRTSHYPQSQDFLNRCDELGLLVFTEIPGWQHIGDEAWKSQAVQNTKDMVRQYRNHVSIILWGVRINESADDDAFYEQTNRAAHELDKTRPTGGVRAGKRSSLLEDVYTYNDFVHDGTNQGCEPKSKVTSDKEKPYLISEYNGHMYPTKSFDWEEHRTEHALRHARVLDAVAAQEDICGSFGWCMADYNTHKDFGSGDRICYHGVMDMFRNAKLAAAVYGSRQDDTPILEISSSMDIGEHPGCNRGKIWIFTNADEVRVYKNDRFLKTYTRTDSPFHHLIHPPLLMDDFVGNSIEENENFKPLQKKMVKEILNATARYGMTHLPKRIYAMAVWLVLIYRMKFEDAVTLYQRYIGDWGGTSTVYRFEALRNGKIVKTITKEPMHQVHLQVTVSNTVLTEGKTYDVAAVRIQAVDENNNVLSFFNEPVTFSTKGQIQLIGPETVSLQGGMGGTYVKTLGKAGEGQLAISGQQFPEEIIRFRIEKMEQEGGNADVG